MGNQTTVLPSEMEAYRLLFPGSIRSGDGISDLRAAGNKIIVLAARIKAERSAVTMDR